MGKTPLNTMVSQEGTAAQSGDVIVTVRIKVKVADAVQVMFERAQALDEARAAVARAHAALENLPKAICEQCDKPFVRGIVTHGREFGKTFCSDACCLRWQVQDSEEWGNRPVTDADIDAVEAKFLKLLKEKEPNHPWLTAPAASAQTELATDAAPVYVYVVVANNTDTDRMTDANVLTDLSEAQRVFAEMKRVYGGANVAMFSRQVDSIRIGALGTDIDLMQPLSAHEAIDAGFEFATCAACGSLGQALVGRIADCNGVLFCNAECRAAWWRRHTQPDDETIKRWEARDNADADVQAVLNALRPGPAFAAFGRILAKLESTEAAQ